MTHALLPVVGRCNCKRSVSGGRSTTVRAIAAAAAFIRDNCNPDPDMAVLTWWCYECKGVAVLTARDLHFAA